MADAAPPVAPQLLDRDRELEQLAERIGAAAAGDGSVVALEGVAGIGKSALLACATRRAADSGMRVLRARGGELEQGISYGVVRQLFDAPLTAMGRDERARMLTGAAGLALPALSIGAASAGLAGEPGSVLHGLYWLTANLAAEQPLLLAIDDAQWADGASVAFLSYLTRRIEGQALLVVVATRSDEGVAEQLPAAAQPDLVACVLRPCALSLASAVTIVGAVLGPCAPEFAKACHTASGGNPFLLRELLRSLHEDGVAPDSESCPRVAQIAPPAISRATLARVRRLGDAATRLASAIAVLGISAQARHAAELARLDLETRPTPQAPWRGRRSFATRGPSSSSTHSFTRRSTSRSRRPSVRSATSGPRASSRATRPGRRTSRRISSRPRAPANPTSWAACASRPPGRALAARRRRPPPISCGRCVSPRPPRTARACCTNWGRPS